ncbi:MAG: hypothetical protein JSR85_04580 [Proteobacteria bacterium]|nr:hypothetical protein [Pseudomonadota bacterium]
MNKYFASLLFLLSSTAFVNSPALSMQEDGFGFVRSKLSSSSDHSDDSEEDSYDDLAAFSGADTTVAVSPLDELEGFLSKQNYPRAFRSMKEGNKASDKEIVAFLLTSNGFTGWSMLSPVERASVVGRIAYEADRDELEEFLSKQNYPLALRSMRESGNTASNEEIVALLLTSNGYAKWPVLSLDKRAWVVERITREEEIDHIRGFLSGQDFPRAFRSMKESGNTASNEEIAEYLIASNGYKRWESLEEDSRRMAFEHIILGEDIKDLQELLKARDFSSAFRSMREGNEASDKEIVAFLLTSNGYTKWDRLREDVKSAVVNSITGEDPVQSLYLFDDRVAFWKAYNFLKASKALPLDEGVVRLILEQKGFKFWDNLPPEVRPAVVSHVARGYFMPFPQADVGLILDEERAAIARKLEKLTEGMAPSTLRGILDVASQIDEKDIEPRVATIMAHLPPLFTQGMTEDDKAFIIQEALKISSEEIGVRMEVLIAHQGNLIPPKANDYDRAEYIVKFLNKTVEQTLAMASHLNTVFPGGMTVQQELRVIDNFRDLATHHISRMADVVLKDEIDLGVDVSPHIDTVAENISKVITSSMNEPDRNVIIAAALRIKARGDIGPRMDAISRNAGPLFKGIVSHSQIADLTGALLGRSTSDIKAIARKAATLYAHLSPAEQVNAIETFVSAPVQMVPVFPSVQMVPVFPSVQMVPLPVLTLGDVVGDHALIIELVKNAGRAHQEAIQENIHKVFTGEMKKVAKRTIIQAALGIEAEEIGPRVEAISRNAGLLFRGINDNNHRALLTEALLTRDPGEIDHIARESDTLYLNRGDIKEQVSIIKQVVFISDDW